MKTPSPGKSLKSGNIGSKSAEFVVSSDSIVILTHSLTRSEGQYSSLRLRGSKYATKRKKLLATLFPGCLKIIGPLGFIIRPKIHVECKKKRINYILKC